MTRARAVGATTFVLAASLLVGCAPGAASGSATPDPERDGPLTEYLAQVFGDSTDPVALADQQRAMQEAVAACMAEQGFDYVPRTPQTAGEAVGGELPEWGSAAFAEQYGYGITTLTELTGGDEPKDPNADLVAALSEAGRAEWEVALYGDGGSTEVSGCVGTAQREVYGGGVLEDPTYLAIQAELIPLYDGVGADAKVLEATRQWSVCMLDVGHDVGSPDEAMSGLYAEVEALDVGAGIPAELVSREIAIATADRTCQEDSGLTAVRAEVERALEEQFVAEHRAELEELVAAAGE
ncbi:hypothetical protein [Cellulomonas triticagri]|uniref:Uncharacterized protein n=1 Tax=Cellulomonas triticagri TaxID=2483352 RepID=A0A3M2JJ97_9CELL|nr:hypothetical protein [Cellulomonas triticagri]RMI13872.1 hypothetical protein EBM89_02560 [Cellulomonas triticagri]